MGKAPVVYLAPVCGLDLEGPSISVGNGAELDRMTDSEMITCIQAGILRSSLFGLPGSFLIQDPIAIRLVSEQPIIVDQGSAGPPSDWSSFREMDTAAQKNIRDTLTGLRLLKRGDVSIAALFVSCPT